MGKKQKNKVKTAEDWCFVCKDGGSLMICDYKNCLKAYHPECVNEDDSLLETEEKWTCNLHFCVECRKAPKFYCLCCPFAICGQCISGGDFAVVKGSKGLCDRDDCLELAYLIEEKKDVDSNGCKIDFSSPDYIYFYEYWLIIKEKECLTSNQVISAYNLLKMGEYCPSDSNSFKSDEEEEYSDDSEDDSHIRKRKRSEGKLSAKKSQVKSSRKEFIGWGSKALLEFLTSIGKDTTRELSSDDVTTIVSEYCKENKLIHPEKKRKVICDARLQALFGRKSVNKNSINRLLTSHFADSVDDFMEDLGSSSEKDDEDDSATRKRHSNSVKKSHIKEAAMVVRQSRFASIVPKNIKLIYLRKSLVVELSKQIETFDEKVMGSFVRVRSDPNDHLQKNSHQLLQVTGTHKTSMNAEILLEVSGRIKGVPTCKLSDDDFSEEEIEDLRQRVKNDLVKRPTVVELRQKARSLHEDITKHWIERQLVLLRNRIDKANERGWRRQFYEDLDKLQKLQTPSEQMRLLNEIPEVIADVEEIQPDCEDSTRKDEEEEDSDSWPESAHRKTCKRPAWNLKTDGVSCPLNDSTDDTAMVTKGKTESFAPSVPARKPSERKAKRSATDVAADDYVLGSNEMDERGGGNRNHVGQGYGNAFALNNGRSSETGSHEPVLVD